jgi:hypothetical protein
MDFTRWHWYYNQTTRSEKKTQLYVLTIYRIWLNLLNDI